LGSIVDEFAVVDWWWFSDADVRVVWEVFFAADSATRAEILPDDCSTVDVFLSIARLATTPVFELNLDIVSCIALVDVIFAEGDIVSEVFCLNLDRVFEQPQKL